MFDSEAKGQIANYSKKRSSVHMDGLPSVSLIPLS